MNRLVSLLSTLTEPVIITDRNMFVIYQNNPSIRLLGDRFGEKYPAVLQGNCQTTDGCPVASAFTDGKYHQGMIKATTADGTVKTIETAAHPVKDKDGDIMECVVFHRDLTAAREAQMHKSDLLSMLSHDLKAHMTVILSYTELLMEKAPQIGDDERAPLNRIKHMAAVSSRLLDDFLALSRIETGKLSLDIQPMSLGALASTYADEFKALASEKDIDIHTDIQKGMPDAGLDMTHCGRVISNVLANAVKYSRHGGRVWVKAGIVQEDPKKVFLEIADEGPGIPEHHLPHITEKYHRAGQTEKTDGAGLGLAIVKALTELHGGSLEIKSREGAGTNVRITLPTAPSTQ